MTGKSAHGRNKKYGYYEHGWAVRRQAFVSKKIFHCDPHRILADRLEPQIWDRILEVLRDPKVAEEIIAEAKKLHQGQGHVKQVDKVRGKVKALEDQIKALAERLAKLPEGVPDGPIYDQLKVLDQLKKQNALELERIQINIGGADLPVELSDYENFTSSLDRVLNSGDESPVVKTKVAKMLVESIEVLPGTFRLNLKVGKHAVLPALQEMQEIPSIKKAKTRLMNAKTGAYASVPLGVGYFFKGGSNNLVNGRGGTKVVEPTVAKRSISIEWKPLKNSRTGKFTKIPKVTKKRPERVERGV